MNGLTNGINGTAANAPQRASRMSGDATISDAQRQALKAEYLRRTPPTIINPERLPIVPGTWRFLEKYDRLFALDIDWDNEVEVTKAREDGVLNQSDYSTPAVCFTPAAAFFNPQQPPLGEGQWEYYTPEDEAEAHETFGDRIEVGFADVPQPTAEQMYSLRLRYWQVGDQDMTRHIRLIWVPAADALWESPSATGRAAGDEDALDDADDEADDWEGADEDDEVVDEDNGIEYDARGNAFQPYLSTNDTIDPVHRIMHDPLNGGVAGNPHDQTADPSHRRYISFPIKGKNITLDTLPATRGTPEPHKLWGYLKRGAWKKWDNHATFDWNNAEHIKNVNKWRTQLILRTTKRRFREERVDFNEEENVSLFAQLVQREGRAPNGRELEEITTAFNARFQRPQGRSDRTLSAISAHLARLRQQYAENNGRWQPKRRRGQHNQEKAAKRRKTIDENEDSTTTTATKRTTKKTKGKKQATREESEAEDSPLFMEDQDEEEESDRGEGDTIDELEKGLLGERGSDEDAEGSEVSE